MRSFVAPYLKKTAPLVPSLLFSLIFMLTMLSHLRLFLFTRPIGNGFLANFLMVMSSLSFCLFGGPLTPAAFKAPLKRQYKGAISV